MKSFLAGIKNVLLWSYERGSWQYDVLCILIVAAIFLVPSRYFGERDRAQTGQANVSANLASKAPANYLMIESKELIDFLQANGREEMNRSTSEAIAFYLQDRLKREVTVVKYEPMMTANGETSYRVWFN